MTAEEPVFVALGSNLGDSPAIIRQAMERLREFSTSTVACSSLWRSAPVDCPPGSPPFVNAAARLTAPARLAPEELLARLQEMETEFGRQIKLIQNEPRPLDLDLIAFGARVADGPFLILPHPRAHRRRFVLQPLAEIAPDFVLPKQRRTVAELLAGMPPDFSMALL